MKNVRDSNIELLRILAMLGVVILHYNNADIGGGFRYVAEGSVNHLLLLGLEGIFICAVNLFLLITGYFSCTSKRAAPIKVVSLVLQVMVFRVLLYIWDVVGGESFSLSSLIYAMLPINYFVILYSAVYLISPYINQMLRGLSKRQMGGLIILCLLLFSFWPTLLDVVADHTGKTFSSLNTLGTNGSGRGYTFVNFTLMYLIGAYLRLADIQVKKRYCTAAILVLTVVLALLGKFIPFNGYVWSYCNPLVIGQAVALFLLFRGISFRSRIVNFLAKGSFTCFLLHTPFLFHFGIPNAVQRSAPYLLGHIFFTTVLVYLLCFIAYVVYDFLSKPVIRLIDTLFQKLGLDIFVEEEDAYVSKAVNKF